LSDSVALSPADVTGLSFETALAELEGIVTRLERGEVALEESIAIYERGEALKAHCESLLRKAEAKVEMISLGADGRPKGVQPLDVDR
jgi:exodeoxyribonuclease VII small subunit